MITAFFSEIAQDKDKICFGKDETIKALEMGAVETLIVWENLEHMRVTLRHPQTMEETVKHIKKEQEKDAESFAKAADGTDLEVIDKISLLEWFAENYRQFGTNLEFITGTIYFFPLECSCFPELIIAIDKSQEGAQFVNGFGGIGGLLRYKVNFAVLADDDDEYYDSDEE